MLKSRTTWLRVGLLLLITAIITSAVWIVYGRGIYYWKIRERFISHPEVTVIMPSYNNAPYINTAIDSVITQTYPYWKLVIIDDGSTDDSVDKILIKKKAYPHRISLFQNKKNKGVYYSRNIGLHNVHTKYFNVLDSDDFFVKDKLEKEVEILEKNPHTIGVISKFVRYQEKTQKKNNPRYRDDGTFRSSILPTMKQYIICRFGSDTEFRKRIQLLYGKKSLYEYNRVTYYALQKTAIRKQLTTIYRGHIRRIFTKYINELHIHRFRSTSVSLLYLLEKYQSLPITQEEHLFNLNIIGIKLQD